MFCPILDQSQQKDGSHPSYVPHKEAIEKVGDVRNILSPIKFLGDPQD
jgi:hypothetical protein